MRRTSLVVLSFASLLAFASVVSAARVRVAASLRPIVAVDASGTVRSETDDARPSRNRFSAEFEVFSRNFAALGIDPSSPAASTVTLTLSSGQTLPMRFSEDRRVAGIGDVTWEVDRRGSAAPLVMPGTTGSVVVNGTAIVVGSFVVN